jgi:hypothetical protein
MEESILNQENLDELKNYLNSYLLNLCHPLLDL